MNAPPAETMRGQASRESHVENSPEIPLQRCCKGLAKAVYGHFSMSTESDFVRISALVRQQGRSHPAREGNSLPPTGKSAGYALDLPTPPQGGSDLKEKEQASPTKPGQSLAGGASVDSCLRRNDRLEGERWLKGPTGELGFGRSSETGAEDKDEELDPRPPIRAFEGMFRHSGVTDWGVRPWFVTCRSVFGRRSRKRPVRTFPCRPDAGGSSQESVEG